MNSSKYIGNNSRKLYNQMGRYAFIRFCRNVGMTFEETYFEMFGRMPGGV